MKNIYVFIIIIFLCSMLFSIDKTHVSSPNTFIDQFPDSEISSIQGGLADFISKIPQDRLSDYGFANDAELGVTRLGMPFRLYFIKPESILDYRKSTTINQILVKTSQWYFPVLVNQEIQAMLVVEESSDGHLTPVSFGYVPLANYLDQAFTSKDWKASNDIKLVVVYQAKEFFLAKPITEPQKLYPLQYEQKKGLSLNNDLGYNLDRIRLQVDANMKGGF